MIKDLSENYLVSVIVICYNQIDYIHQTLEGIFNQKCEFEIEVIIGDDASTDGTYEFCEKYIKYKENYRLLPVERNLGLIKNYMRCVGNSKGKYIAVCAGDDYWVDDDKLQKQVTFLEKNLDYGLVFTNFFSLKGKIIEKQNVNITSPTFDSLLRHNNIPALTVMYRKKYYTSALDLGLFNKGFEMEDYPLWLHIATQSNIGFIPDYTAVYRVQPQSLSNLLVLEKIISFNKSIFEIRRFFCHTFERYNQLKIYEINYKRSMLLTATNNRNVRYSRSFFKDLIMLKDFRLSNFYLYIKAEFLQIFSFLNNLTKLN